MLLKWWRERSAQERWMLGLVAVLLLGIAVRWAWVSSEVAGAWRERFSAPTEQTPPNETTAQPDSTD